MSKRESVEEFLKRGGVITKLAPVVEEEKEQTMMSKSGVSSMMSLSEGSIYYAEQKAKKASKKKVVITVDFSSLPAHLMKFVPVTNEDS